MTGSAKTDVLHALRNQEAQVLDLEGLAKHLGRRLATLKPMHSPAQNSSPTSWRGN